MFKFFFKYQFLLFFSTLINILLGFIFFYYYFKSLIKNDFFSSDTVFLFDRLMKKFCNTIADNFSSIFSNTVINEPSVTISSELNGVAPICAASNGSVLTVPVNINTVTDPVSTASTTSGNSITNFFMDCIFSEKTIIVVGLFLGGVLIYYFFNNNLSSIDSRIYDLQKDVCAINVKLDASLNQSYKLYQHIDVLSNKVTSISPGGFASTWSSLFSGSTHSSPYVDLLPVINTLYENSSLFTSVLNSQSPFGLFFATCTTALGILHQTLLSGSIIPDHSIVDVATTVVTGLDTTLVSPAADSAASTAAVTRLDTTLVAPAAESSSRNTMVIVPSTTLREIRVPTDMRQSNLFN